MLFTLKTNDKQNGYHQKKNVDSCWLKKSLQQTVNVEICQVITTTWTHQKTNTLKPMSASIKLKFWQKFILGSSLWWITYQASFCKMIFFYSSKSNENGGLTDFQKSNQIWYSVETVDSICWCKAAWRVERWFKRLENWTGAWIRGALIN